MKKSIFLIWIMLFMCHVVWSQSSHDSVVITLKNSQRNLGDTLQLIVKNDFYSYNSFFLDENYKVYTAVRKGDDFRFKLLNLSRISFVDIKEPKWKRAIFGNFIIEGGDSVFIDIKNIQPVMSNYYPDKGIIVTKLSGYNHHDISFYGKGALKYECLNKMNNLESKIHDQQEYEDSVNRVNPIQNRIEINKDTIHYLPVAIKYWGTFLHILTQQINILEDYKAKISNPIYDILKAQIVGIQKSKIYKDFRAGRNYHFPHQAPEDSANFCKYYRDILSANKLTEVPDSILQLSPEYIRFMLFKAICDNYIYNGSGSLFYWIKSNFDGILRDKILGSYIIDNYEYINDKENVLKDAMKTVKVDNILEKFREILDRQSIGRQAYDFALFDKEGKMIRLSSLKDKVVFVDFWYTGCGGCAQYYQNVLSKVEEVYKNQTDVVFVTINSDEKSKWLKSLKNGYYTSAQALNLNSDGLGKDNNPVYKYYNVTSYPRPILINKGNKIFSMDLNELRNTGSGDRKAIQILSGAIERALKTATN